MPSSPACSPAASAPRQRAGKGAAALDADELAVLAKALAHPARVRLLLYLADHGTCYFGDLSEVVGLAPSTTSQHVKILRDAGLVCGTAEERRTCYCVDGKRLATFKRLVEAL
jgi:ArsR family transcriptional regulator